MSALVELKPLRAGSDNRRLDLIGIEGDCRSAPSSDRSFWKRSTGRSRVVSCIRTLATWSRHIVAICQVVLKADELIGGPGQGIAFDV